MHVDGFRFDEGTILIRNEHNVDNFPTLIYDLLLDPVFEYTKFIAEAWDAGSLYRVGNFPGHIISTWNGVYRDTVRKFVKSEDNLIGKIADVLTGSSSLFQHSLRLPKNGINFITCHDGFTLNDLVSYNNKTNNGGIDDNNSWNCGHEGPSDDVEIERLRDRQVKNFLTILFISRGIPMLLGGDEFRRTQLGDNDPYNQDNEINWFDWEYAKRYEHIKNFCASLIKLRKDHEVFKTNDWFKGTKNKVGMKDLEWYGTMLTPPNWQDSNAHALSFTLGAYEVYGSMHVMINTYWEDLIFEVPLYEGVEWRRVVDTFEESPHDFLDIIKQKETIQNNYLVRQRSIVILEALEIEE